MSNRFIEAFKSVCSAGVDDYRVWSAFVTMSAADIAAACGNEAPNLFNEADELKATYSDSLDAFREMLNAVVESLERNPDQDMLGSVYMELGISSKDKGQFFTPYNLARASAEVALGRVDAAISEKAYVTVNDPAAGGGAMLIGAFNVLRERGFNPQTQAWFEAQDLSMDTAMMCYVQMALLGMAGRVIIGDTLRMQQRLVLRLPMNIIEPVWAARYLRGDVPC